jgi:glycosyltransferase involved in cell wall biosynthesis
VPKGRDTFRARSWFPPREIQASVIVKNLRPLRGRRRRYVEDVSDDEVVCDVVIPCRDEAPALPALLAELPYGFRALVVDNGSRDRTAEVALELGATVVEEPRPGYGAAVHAGLEAATAEYVAVMDGDGSMDPGDLLPLLELVVTGAADLAVGRRRPTRRGVWPWHARAGNAVVLWWLRRRLALPVHDIAPMRVARRDRMIALNVEDRRFGYPVELLQRAALAHWRFAERDIAYHPRAAGTRSKVSGSLVGTVRTARDFARVLA